EQREDPRSTGLAAPARRSGIHRAHRLALGAAAARLRRAGGIRPYSCPRSDDLGPKTPGPAQLPASCPGDLSSAAGNRAPRGCVALVCARARAHSPHSRRRSMAQQLSGKKIAILATDGFEQSELLEPQRALKEAGATVHVVSPKSGTIRGWKEANWGDEVQVDVELSQARPEDYDGLVLPGGQINPDKLRLEPKAVQFVRAFFEAGKPVGAICHGPWLLVEADVVRGRTVTSYGSIKTDLKNAGA